MRIRASCNPGPFSPGAARGGDTLPAEIDPHRDAGGEARVVADRRARAQMSTAALLAWLRARDRGSRGAAPGGARGDRHAVPVRHRRQVIGNPDVATFAAFGSFAMLLLVDFSGPMRERLQAQAALALAGAVLVCARHAGVTRRRGSQRSRWRSSRSACCSPESSARCWRALRPRCCWRSSSPSRCRARPRRSPIAWWAGAWPRPCRSSRSRCCGRRRREIRCARRRWRPRRALAARLRAEVAYVLRRRDARRRRAARGDRRRPTTAVAALHRGFLATPYRPTGLSTPRAHDRPARRRPELAERHRRRPSRSPGAGALGRPRATCKVAAAAALERGADLLEAPAGEPRRRCARPSASCGDRCTRWSAARRPSCRLGSGRLAPRATSGRCATFLTALDPSFRAQELSFAVSQIARNIELTVAAERRGWWERLLGRQPEGVGGALSAAARSARRPHLEPALASGCRTACAARSALGLAVLVANRRGVQHSFWVVFGTLSVLRSNALNTGQFIARGVARHGRSGSRSARRCSRPSAPTPTLLWVLLPFAVLFAGVAPAVISFAAGQAAFTLTLLILFNIIQPAGWQHRARPDRGRRARLRREPRRRAAVLATRCRRRAAQGAGRGVRRQRALPGQGVEFGMHCCDSAGRPPPRAEPTRPPSRGGRLAAARRRVPQLPGRTRGEARPAGGGDQPRHRRRRACA